MKNQNMQKDKMIVRAVTLYEKNYGFKPDTKKLQECSIEELDDKINKLKHRLIHKYPETMDSKNFFKTRFLEHIFGMMDDNNATLGDVLLWDFESIRGINIPVIMQKYGIHADDLIEKEFVEYLRYFDLEESDVLFFTDIIMGRSTDFFIKREEK